MLWNSMCAAREKIILTPAVYTCKYFLPKFDENIFQIDKTAPHEARLFLCPPISHYLKGVANLGGNGDICALWVQIL